MLLACGAGWWIGASGVAFADGSFAEGGAASAASVLQTTFAVPAVQSLDGAQQQQEEAEITYASPEAARGREESQTEFEALSSSAAASVDGAAFPAIIQEHGGGPPQLAAGQNIVGYPTDSAAELTLGNGQHGVIESLEPMAMETSPGHRQPIDLSPAQAAGWFAPTASPTAVRFPRHLANGAQLSIPGLSLTPIDEHGRPLEGAEGSIDGQIVFYGGAGPNMDVALKATTRGFAESSILRSLDSPEALYFRVGLPQGATLVQNPAGSGPVDVVDEGQPLAYLLPPRAQDAAGTPVPVSMSVSGDELTLTVNHQSGSYRYPIEVDPEFDSTTEGIGCYGSWAGLANWHWHPGAGYGPYEGRCALSFRLSGTFSQGDRGYWELTTNTHGYERIRSFAPRGWAYAPGIEGDVIGHVAIVGSGCSLEEPFSLNYNSSLSSVSIAEPGPNCDHNAALIETTTLHSGSGESLVEVEGGNATIVQEKGLHSEVSYSAASELSYSTTEPEVHKTENVLRPGGGWLSASSGALEATTTDGGLGVAETKVEVYRGGKWETLRSRDYLAEAEACKGIECSEKQHEVLTYPMLATGLVNGHNKIRVAADSAMPETWSSAHGEGEVTVNVDTIPPHGLALSGLPAHGTERTEVEMGEGVAHITLEATDGENGVPSSGVKSIELYVDGRYVGQATGAASHCQEGPCTAKGELLLSGAAIGTGTHTLTVKATDNAGNFALRTYLLSVSQPSAVAMGPGQVGAQSGNLVLSRTDVDISGGMGALEVTRSYDSRNANAGALSPLGPQWYLSLGSQASLEVLPDGSVMVVGPAGLTMFTAKPRGGYEAPSGDQNLTLERIGTEFLFKEPAKGAETVFTQPEGTTATAPTWSGQLGSAGSGTTELEHPSGVAVDAQGDLWVTDSGNNRVKRLSPSGTELAEFTESGSQPEDVAVSPTTERVYVTNTGHNQLDELSMSGKLEKAIGSSGTTGGEFNNIHGVAVAPSGNIWVTDWSNDRIQEFAPSGTFKMAVGWGVNNGAAKAERCTWGPSCRAGIAGSGAGQFSEPSGIAVCAGHVYVVDLGNNRVEQFSLEGEYERQFGKEGTENGQFKSPSRIACQAASSDLYVGDKGNNRIQEFTAATATSTAGEFLDAFGSPGKGPEQFSTPVGVAVGPQHEVYVVDSGDDRVESFSYPTWMPTTSESPAATDTTTDAYRALAIEGKTVIEPTLEVAPHPQATCVPGHFEKGCRALEFTYAKATNATGEQRNEWGEYQGRLTQVLFTGYNPETGTMQEHTPVAEYAYDKQGRLRAEWDPQVDSETKKYLETTYGYDAQGHVTAVTAPGQEPSVITYGTVAGDLNAGRVIKTMRPLASTELWQGSLPADTETPTLAGSAVTGIKMAVSTGRWGNAPVAYGYQWQDCNAAGAECVAIGGATNENYTPVASDVGYSLRAQVTATNSGGSVVATSAASLPVTSASAARVSTFGKEGSGQGELSSAEAVARDSEGHLWIAEAGNDRVQELKETTEGDQAIREVGSKGEGSGQLLDPSGVAIDSEGNVWVADVGNRRLEEFSATGTFKKVVGWCVTSGVPELETCIGGECRPGIGGSGGGEFSSNTEKPVAVSVDTHGNVWVTDPANHRLQEFSSSGSFERAVGWGVANEHSELQTCTSDCKAGIPGEGAGQLSFPVDLAIDPSGHVIVSDFSDDRIAEYGEKGEYLTEFKVSRLGSGIPYGIAVNQYGILWVAEPLSGEVGAYTEGGEEVGSFKMSGGLLYGVGLVLDSAGDAWVLNLNQLQRWTIPVFSAGRGTQYGPEPGSTIDYAVPVSGAGAPHPMSASEVAKWGQKDDPVEATAVFPPDEPQGWPATDYRRATVYYMDSQARTVNVAAPSTAAYGSISTDEYNEYNEAVRSLGPDQRATALAEGCKSESECRSAEVSTELDNRSTYNPEGTELLESRGPQHLVQLSTGARVLARNHSHYYYDEGAPPTERYGLVTKTTVGAQYEGTETETREARTTYSGQSGLGWTLRKPTSVTDEPTPGHPLTNSTVYNPETGEVTETTSPAGNTPGPHHPIHTSLFGTQGEFSSPANVAIDGQGNVWVADCGNDRVVKLSAQGTYLAAYGAYGTGSEEFNCPGGIAINQSTGTLYVSDYWNGRVMEMSNEGKFVGSFATNGSGAGQLSRPQGISIDPSGDLWVADRSNNRIDEFSSAGVFKLAIGYGVKDGKAQAETCTSGCQAGIAGSGEGQFSSPTSLAVSGGNVYVADAANRRVEELSTSGSYLATLGSGQLSWPEGITADAAGNLWVDDTGSAAVDEFSARGVLLTSFGSVGTAEGQMEEPLGVAVSGQGNVYVADYGNNRIDEWKAGSFIAAYDSKGKSSGQLEQPYEVAIDGSGNLWVAECGNSRLQEFTPSGRSLATYGSYGTEREQFKCPAGVAINRETGRIYATDYLNDRVMELSGEGKFLGSFGAPGSGAGQLSRPAGARVDSQGNVWAVDSGNNRIDEFSSEGQFKMAVGWGVANEHSELQTCTSSCKVGLAGSGNGQFREPIGIAIYGSDLYVTDAGNHRVEVLSTEGKYVSQFGSEQLGSPAAVATDDSGNVYVVDQDYGKVFEFAPSGVPLGTLGSPGSSQGQLREPVGVAIDYAGDAYVTDGNGRLEEWHPASFVASYGAHGAAKGQLSHPGDAAVDAQGDIWLTNEFSQLAEFSSAGALMHTYGSWGTGKGQMEDPQDLTINPKGGEIYVADELNDRVDEFSASGEALGSVGTEGSGAGGLKEPLAVAIDASGDLWVTDRQNDRVDEFSAEGKFKMGLGWGVANEHSELQTCTSICKVGIKGSGQGQFNEPSGIAIAGGVVYVGDLENGRVDEFGEKGEYKGQFGSRGSGEGQLEYPATVAVSPQGGIYVADTGNSRIDVFSTSGKSQFSFGAGGTGAGQLDEPEGLAFGSAGEIYVADSVNNRVSTWREPNEAVHSTQTIYYTPKTEARVTTCQNHPEWAGLPCQIQPAAQPDSPGLPNLPVTTVTYNIWDQPATRTETVGSNQRTTITKFDPAGRPLTTSVISTTGKPQPPVTDTYSESTGLLVEQSMSVEGNTEAIKGTYNRLGELTSYTDSNGKTTTYQYDEDGRQTKVEEEVGEKGHASQTYAYESSSGALDQVTDSEAGVFTATYDAAGKLTSASWPNGMRESYSYNPVGESTEIEYVKTTHCSSGCTLYSDSIVPSIHGEAISEESTHEGEPNKMSYQYDQLGRLTQVQETPYGKGCTTRIYGYDEESNRTSLTTRESGTSECASSGGKVEEHLYDEANRLVDSGVSYEGIGNITNLPKADSGGAEGGQELSTSYLADSQVFTQHQAQKEGEQLTEKTITYRYDPEGRTRETLSSGASNTDVVSHYAGAGGSPAWTSEGGEAWTRNIGGIDGSQDAIGANGEAEKAVLQLHDLKGDVVATIADKEAEVKLASFYQSTEFGVPTTSKPPPFSWLGAAGVKSELASGVVTIGGSSYVPQTGRALQTSAITVPQPLNAASAFVSQEDPLVAAYGAAWSAQQVATAAAAEQAASTAPTPPGVVELFPVYVPPEGTNAVAASHHLGVMRFKEEGNGYLGCSIWTSYDHPFSLDGNYSSVEIEGHWECTNGIAPEFRMQIQLVAWDEETDGFIGVAPAYEQGWKKLKKEHFAHSFNCPVEHAYYFAWMYGEQFGWGGVEQWHAVGIEREQWKGNCTGHGLAPVLEHGPPPPDD